MIDLLRRDPALRSLPRWLFMVPMFSLAMAGMTALWLFRGLVALGVTLSLPSVVLVLTLWLPLVAYLLFGRITQRCTHMDLGLPVPARRLWRAHLVGALLASLTILASEFLIMGLGHALLSGLAKGRAGATATLMSILLPSLATLTAAVATLQMPDLGVLTVHRVRTRWLLASILVPGGPVLILALSLLPWWTSVLVMASTLALLWRLERSVPAAFTLIPLAAAPAHTRHQPAATYQKTRPRSRTGLKAAVMRQLTILRIMSGGVAPGQIVKFPTVLLGIPVILGWGVLLSGLFIGQKAGALFLTLSAYVLFAFIPALLAQVHILDPLPISRRNLFASAVLPGLLLLGLGYGLGILAQDWRQPVPAVEYQAARSRLYPEITTKQPVVRVPMVACKLAWAENVPILTSPWGEEHPAWSKPILKEGRLHFYSPYGTAEAASVRFVALQISRAIEGVYGTSIPPQEIRRRYLDPVNPAGGSLERGRNSLYADFPELRKPMLAPQAPLFFTITSLILLTMLALYNRALRATVSQTGRMVTMFSVLGAIFALQVAQLALGVSNLVDIDLAAGTMQIGALVLATTLPGGVMTLWVAGGLLFLGAYLLTERSFRRIEAPVGPLCRGTSGLV